MFQDLWVKHRAWMFKTVGYAGVDELVEGLDVLIKRAQACAAKLVVRKAKRVQVTHSTRPSQASGRAPCCLRWRAAYRTGRWGQSRVTH
jgi:hypothetical protein